MFLASKEQFSRWVVEHQGAVYAVAYSMLGNRAASEEIAQEAFLVAWRKLPSLGEAPKMPAWVCGIARNLARNAKRQAAPTDGTDALDSVATANAGPLEELLGEETNAVVARALDALPETYREPLVLFYGCNESIRSVAAALDISEAAAKQRLSRGRTQLEQSVQEIVTRSLKRLGPGPAFTAAVLAAITAAGVAPAVASAAPLSSKPAAKPVIGKVALAGAAAAMIGAIAVASVRGARDGASAAPTSTTTAHRPIEASRGGASGGKHHAWIKPRQIAPATARAARPSNAAAERPRDGDGELVSDKLLAQLDTKIDLELKEASVPEILRLLSEVSGVPILERGRIDPKVSIRLRASTVLDALDQVLDQAAAVWRETPAVRIGEGLSEPVETPEGPEVTLELSATPLSTAVEAFAEPLEMPIFLADLSSAPPTVTARFVKMPAGDALRAVVKQAGLSFEVVDVIEVWPEGEVDPDEP